MIRGRFSDPTPEHCKIQTLQGEWEMREEPWVYTALSA